MTSNLFRTTILVAMLGLGPATGHGAELSAWREPETGMEFLLMKGGCYAMGDTFGDGDHNEVPVHEVCVSDFYLGRHEVTQGQWERLMGENPAAFAEGPDYPIESIRLDEIEEYILRLNQLGHGTFRLPTEAEWEYACRAGGKERRFGTETGAYGAELANVAAEDGEEDPWPETAPVGSFPPNEAGFHDMSGNVWEWVADIYAPDAYAKHQEWNPLYREEGPSRMVRGGSWSHESHFARCSKRHMHCRPSVRYDIIGFRLVREP
ncbi:MAG: SUMF1/EgtB/PvdO family nonheme iron enzyme [Gammaproteobacteria bacterium]|nr:SUMF1/EgtB/PvdO family nonheme iron enzyme [Gammaproteobacteria bacterium]